MDRSFLSSPEVVEASRKFVCVRLATYEDAREGTLLKNLFRTRSGDLENSVFAILSPDGKHQLVRSGRSTRMVFGNASNMAATMNEIGDYYRGQRKTPLRPPSLANVRLGINVAACDRLPLVVTVGRDRTELRRLERRLAALSVNDLAGRALFASTSRMSDLAKLKGQKLESGFLVVFPDTFGQSGEIVARITPDQDVSASLARALGRFRRPALKERHQHVRAGRQKGIQWQTAVPVTDPGSLRARGH